MHGRLIRNARWAAALFITLTLEPTRCGTPPINAAEFPPAIVITEGKTSQGFPFLFGGISSNEREVMEQRAKSYNLKLVFAEKNGSFLSGITVVVTSMKVGEIVSIATDGPWFYMQLPPGTYRVTAIFKGQTKQINNLVIKDKTVQQIFTWDLAERPEP
jgi:hypothetical protein